MCGITGFIDYTGKSSDKTLSGMTDAISHRGPDDSGAYFNPHEKFQVGLGHRRLAIIDTSRLGRQPMHHEHLIMVYNGEVYNYRELRGQLLDLGYVFKSQTDSEVVLKAFHCWGVNAVEHFIGMFAICLYDKRAQKVYLIRDRAGVKPLFWYWDSFTFLFSSELGSFLKHPNFPKKVDREALAAYVQLGYVPYPRSIFNNAFKICPGSFLEFNIVNKEFSEKHYWKLEAFYEKPYWDVSEEEAKFELEEILKSACRYRLIADVPVGVFLSGGYDSSLVAALLQSQSTQKIRTFTIGFDDERYNEACFARQVADYLGTNHQDHYCGKQDAIDIIPELPSIYDEPLGDQSTIPTVLVSRMAKREVSVALSADGGDEIFAGYDKYRSALKLEKLSRLSLSKYLPESFLKNTFQDFNSVGRKYKSIVERGIALAKRRDDESTLRFMNYLSPAKAKNLVNCAGISGYRDNFYINTDRQNIDALNKMLLVDFKTYMVDDVLSKVDRATMSIGLEGREPLLDHRIVEYAARLSPKMKLKGTSSKIILKDIVHEYVPKEIMCRPKMGFGIPLHEWLHSDLKYLVDQYLNPNSLKDHVLNRHNVKVLVDNFHRHRGNKQLSNQVWYLIVFQLWQERWGVNDWV